MNRNELMMKHPSVEPDCFRRGKLRIHAEKSDELKGITEIYMKALDEIGGKIIKVVPRDASVQVAENQGKTVVEALPESEMAGVYMDLACKILAECDMELPPGQQESA